MSSPAASAAPAWANRIVASGTEAPNQLLANPANWRVHPKAQQEALAAVLDEVGWVQQVLVNQRTGHVVDGHRSKLDPLLVRADIARVEEERPDVAAAGDGAGAAGAGCLGGGRAMKASTKGY